MLPAPPDIHTQLFYLVEDIRRECRCKDILFHPYQKPCQLAMWLELWVCCCWFLNKPLCIKSSNEVLYNISVVSNTNHWWNGTRHTPSRGHTIGGKMLVFLAEECLLCCSVEVLDSSGLTTASGLPDAPAIWGSWTTSAACWRVSCWSPEFWALAVPSFILSLVSSLMITSAEGERRQRTSSNVN